MPLIQRGEEGKALGDSIMIETDLFEHREVKPHFINACCFGEDFAAWLRQELSRFPDLGFELSEPIQEDYGWGFGLHAPRTASGLLFPTSGMERKNRLLSGSSPSPMIPDST
jgi:hypothetical protein